MQPPTKRLELGVFLPIGNNGFLMSSTAPQYKPSFEMNRQIATLAETFGFDFVFSMSKWRGFGGRTQFWDATLESLSLMTGLAAATTRIGLVATVSPLLFNPAVAAKMTATVDDIAQGRLGLNIVTGSFLDEYEQMGPLPHDYKIRRYEYAREWIHVLKRLWTEESVSFDGEWFHLSDCQSGPKPLQKPRPTIICAGTSDEGMRFTAQEGDYSFLTGASIDHTMDQSRRMKVIAKEYGRTIKTAMTVLPIMGETDEAAKEQWQHLQAGADKEALLNLSKYYSKQGRSAAEDRITRIERDVTFAGQIVAGSPKTIADMIERLVVDGQLDCVQLLFVDYIEGLKTFHAEVMPLLRQRDLLGAI